MMSMLSLAKLSGDKVRAILWIFLSYLNCLVPTPLWNGAQAPTTKGMMRSLFLPDITHPTILNLRKETGFLLINRRLETKDMPLARTRVRSKKPGF